MADALIGLEEAARDLLAARDRAPRHVGFRLDLWQCLRACLNDRADEWLGWKGGMFGTAPAVGDVNVDITDAVESVGSGLIWTGPAAIADWSQECRYRISAEQPEA